MFDIESNGLLDTGDTLWCLGIMDITDPNNKTYHHYVGDDLRSGIDRLREADVIIGHNIIDFDIPFIEKVTGIDVVGDGKVIDTVICSRLLKPDMLAGHSLSAWGKRLGHEKMDFRAALIEAGALEPASPKGSEFLQFHPLMLPYMQTDVEVTEHVLRAVLAIAQKEWAMDEVKFTNSLPFRLEHETQRLLSKQARTGWLFDVKRAKWFLRRVNQIIDIIDEKVVPQLPKHIKARGNPVQRPVLKSGQPSKAVVDWYGYEAGNVAGPFTRIEVCTPSLQSDKQLKEALIKLGWRPTEFTDTGGPRLTEDSLVKWGGRTGEMIAKRMMYKHRRGLVEGLLAAVREDGRVGAGGIAQGAVTGRVTHRVVANIPRYTSPCGKTIRSLFRAPEGRVLVGCDAAGIELRCLAHYLGDDEVTREILEGDIHQKNADAVQVDRNCVKTLTYAWLYGAGDEKLGSTLLDSTGDKEWAGTKEEGSIARAKFIESMNAESLIERVSAMAAMGHIKAIDGRRIPIRSEHAALNTLLQACGALIMKMAYCKLGGFLENNPHIPAKLLCFYHDEYTVETTPEYADYVGRLMSRCIVWAGEVLELSVPLAGDPQVGLNWKEIH